MLYNSSAAPGATCAMGIDSMRAGQACPRKAQSRLATVLSRDSTGHLLVQQQCT